MGAPGSDTRRRGIWPRMSPGLPGPFGPEGPPHPGGSRICPAPKILGPRCTLVTKRGRPTYLGWSLFCCFFLHFGYIAYFGAWLLWRSECRPWPLLAAGSVLPTCLGVRQRLTIYSGQIVVESGLDIEVALSFHSSDGTRQLFLERLGDRLPPRGRFVLDPPVGEHFDFRLIAKTVSASPPQELVATVVRTATYRLVGLPLALQEVVGPIRRRSDLLASAPAGLSFGFSAAGWLLTYEFGAAQCLQNHGITRNPHVRLAGASGGALSLWTMMYGCDMKALKDFMKDSAGKVYSDFTQSMNLRTFVLDAMKTVLRDCSFRHPTFVDGRVEIVMSEAPGLISGIAGVFGSSVRSRRVRHFNDSADIAIALLASSSIGISGLPFSWGGGGTPQDQAPLVADGAFADFLPEVDEWSVKLKPFSDGLNVLGRRPPDVAPTEFVPPSYGIWPPDAATMDHLFELGYRDMEAWLDTNLESHLEKMPRQGAAQSEALQRHDDFQCGLDGGTKWIHKVHQIVPINWKEQLFFGPGDG